MSRSHTLLKHNTAQLRRIVCQLPSPILSIRSVLPVLPTLCVKRTASIVRFPLHLTVHAHTRTAMCRKSISFLLTALVFCIIVFPSCPTITTDATASSMRIPPPPKDLLLGLMPSCGVSRSP
jgi:hypothetical protein